MFMRIWLVHTGNEIKATASINIDSGLISGLIIDTARESIEDSIGKIVVSCDFSSSYL
jgi:hypothetical protein